MTTFFRHVFGRNTQSSSKKGASTGTTSSGASTPPLIPFVLQYVK
jgi:hypothetical protein